MIRVMILTIAISCCIAQGQQSQQPQQNQQSQQNQQPQQIQQPQQGKQQNNEMQQPEKDQMGKADTKKATMLNKLFTECMKGKHDKCKTYLAKNYMLECPKEYVSKGWCPSKKMSLADIKPWLKKFKDTKITMGPKVYGSGKKFFVSYSATTNFNGKKIPETNYMESVTFDDSGKIAKSKLLGLVSNLVPRLQGNKIQSFDEKLPGSKGMPQNKNLAALKQCFQECLQLQESQKNMKCAQCFADDLQVKCDKRCVAASSCPCKQETYDKAAFLKLLQMKWADKKFVQALKGIELFGSDMDSKLILQYVTNGKLMSILETIKFNDKGKITNVDYQLPTCAKEKSG